MESDVLALTPNTVELIPTLGARFPRGGPVQDLDLTYSLAGDNCNHRISSEPTVRLYRERKVHLINIECNMATMDSFPLESVGIWALRATKEAG